MKAGWKRRLALMLALVLLGLLPCGPWAAPEARADTGVTAKARIAVYDRDTEYRIRQTGCTSWSRSGLKSNEYLTFEIETYSSRHLKVRNVYARIDGGEKLEWVGSDMEAGASGYMHIYRHHMEKLPGGVHRLDFYINDELVLTQYLTLLPSTDWDRLIRQPDSGELLSFRPTDISPYICCYPQFKGVKGYTEYAVDFRADRLPYGTYLACANFSMTSDSLNAANARVWNDVNGDGLFAYCGFQELHDGSRVAICSVWDTYVTDKQGRTSTIRAEVFQAANPIKAGGFDGEGVGAQCLVPYNWEPCNTYRMLLQLRKSEETGTQHLSMWVLDMDSMSWTMLIEYDLKVPDAYMHDNCAFLENYLTEFAADVRTMELSNIRALSLDGRWVGTREAVFCLGYEHPGSYTYGSSGNTFYAITTGLPDRCPRPQDWLTVTVDYCESGAPY